VLSEKMKGVGPGLSEGLQKNFIAMKEQISRMDVLLRRFSEFVAAPLSQPGELDFSEVVERALEVLGYEARKRRVKVHHSLAVGLRTRSVDAGVLRQTVLQLLFGCIEKTTSAEQIQVSTRRTGENAVLEVSRSHSEPEPTSEGFQGILALCRECGFDLKIEGARLELAVNVG
jgi:C4-dicarboxylate-specific signal transduction histidine kinase